MDPRAQLPMMSVSNLVPVWDEPDVDSNPDGGGSFAPTEAATVVAHVLRAEVTPETRRVTPPEHFDPTDFVERQSSFSYDLLDERDSSWAERTGPVAQPVHVELETRSGDDDRQAIAPVTAGSTHERRSAYEIAFILLTAAVAVLLSAPPLVQILLAARGIQA